MADGGTIVLTEFELLERPTRSSLEDVAAAEREAWIPVRVPGGVHEALIAAGRIGHPCSGDGERAAAWVESRDWWFRTRFDGPASMRADERLRLVLAGLDTVADVWLNGVHVAASRNMFREVVLDVTDAVAERNEVLVRFRPPLEGLEVPAVAAAQVARMAALMGDALGAEDDERLDRARATQVRKAPLSWGWDFAPNVPNIGVWRPVTLRRERAAVISGHRVRTELDDTGRATVTVVVEADAFAHDGDLVARVRLTSPSGTEHAAVVTLPAGSAARTGEAVLVVEEPQLWWTHDLGTPHLHALEIRLEGGEVLDVVSRSVGLRTVALDRSPDVEEGGRFFRIVLNGVPLHVRGAAWVPPSVFVGSGTDATYRDRIALARDGNLNLLRVWGGGVYEQDAFYAICDELGVAVWQDFVFACSPYPSDDPALVAEVAAEAEYQVRRLRDHASLVLWAGSNEVQVIHAFLFQSLEPGGWGSEFFDEILPAAVARLDGTVPYWPGSPYGEVVGDESVAEAVSGMLDGDTHSWTVWHGATMEPVGPGHRFATAGEAMHYRRYAEERGKLVSEFGVHSSANLSTLEKWLPAEALQVHSGVLDLHNKDNPKDKGDWLMEVVTGLPTTIEEYVDFSQTMQAEGMAFGLAHLRRRQPHTSGAIVWMFDDIWPGASWALVDSEGAPKAAYWTVRRAAAPVALGFKDVDGGGVELHAVNSTREPVDAEVEVEVGRFDGAERRTMVVEAHVPPFGSARIWQEELPALVGSSQHYLWASSAALAPVRHHFVAPKELEAGPSRLEWSVREHGGGRATVDIQAHGYAYLVHIPAPDGSVRFSDGWFDLRDGDRAVIEVSGLPDGLDRGVLAPRASLVARGARS